MLGLMSSGLYLTSKRETLLTWKCFQQRSECFTKFFIQIRFYDFLCSLLCLISANIFRISNFDKASLAFRSFSSVKNNLCKDKHVIGFGLAKKKVEVSFCSSHDSNKNACFRVIMENSWN